jgi:hypothetical protein
MRVAFTGTAVLAAVIAWGVPAAAHHSIGMFDTSTPIWVKGTFVRMDRINPHAVITLEEKKPDGTVQRWTLEGTSAQGLRRMGIEEDFLKAGDVIEVCAFALKEQFSSRPTSPSDSGSRFVHGHLLVMPDGHMQMWGGYGTLENCVRPDDRIQSWLTFVDSRGREAWCSGKTRASGPSVTTSKRFVEEIDSRMANPCPH